MRSDIKKKKPSKSLNSGEAEGRKSRGETKESKKNVRGKKRMLSDEDAYERKELKLTQYSFTNPVLYNIDRTVGHSNHVCGSKISKFYKKVIIDQLKRFRISEAISPFDRRVTAITWHPKYPQISVAGSKGGDLTLHSFSQSDDYLITGVGAGGSILGLKFSDQEFTSVYTASLTGKINLERFETQKSSVLFALPFSYDNWFTSLDVCYNRQLLLSGDCSGNIYGVKTSGGLEWKVNKLHKSKISHCEFNIHDPNIFVTASVDRFVKLWDLRCIREDTQSKKPVPLMMFPHEKGVNSAYFSPSNGLSLLTTDQHSEIRVYSSPGWSETLLIIQPHRQFQHMTPIKAIWHPMEDIIIVGRYPDENIQADDARTVDIFDGTNGELLHSIPSPSGNIVSLNAINSTGDALASNAGYSIVYLKDENILKGVSSKHESDDESENKNPGLDLKKTRKRTKTPSKTLNTKTTKMSLKSKTKSV